MLQSVQQQDEKENTCLCLCLYSVVSCLPILVLFWKLRFFFCLLDREASVCQLRCHIIVAMMPVICESTCKTEGSEENNSSLSEVCTAGLACCIPDTSAEVSERRFTFL